MIDNRNDIMFYYFDSAQPNIELQNDKLRKLKGYMNTYYTDFNINSILTIINQPEFAPCDTMIFFDYSGLGITPSRIYTEFNLDQIHETKYKNFVLIPMRCGDDSVDLSEFFKPFLHHSSLLNDYKLLYSNPFESTLQKEQTYILVGRGDVIKLKVDIKNALDKILLLDQTVTNIINRRSYHLSYLDQLKMQISNRKLQFYTFAMTIMGLINRSTVELLTDQTNYLARELTTFMDKNNQTIAVTELLKQTNRDKMRRRAQEIFVIDDNHTLIPFDQKLKLLQQVKQA